MGSCMSSPHDDSAVQTANQSVQNGSEEAALIYNGNMNISSKVTVLFYFDIIIQLSFECSNLPKLDLTSKSDPFIVVYIQNGSGCWSEIGRTEVIVNTQEYLLFLMILCSPKFVQKVMTVYKFEEIQHMKFVVYDADSEGASSAVLFNIPQIIQQLDLDKQDLVGEVLCDLPSLVHSTNLKKMPIMLKKKQRGEMIVKCEELNQSCGNFHIHLTGQGVVKNSFIEISNILFHTISNIFLHFHIWMRRMVLHLFSRQRFHLMEYGMKYQQIFQFFVIVIM